MKSIYATGEYLAKNPTWSVEDSPWKADRILDLLRRNNVCPKTVCEIGCGAGQILNHLYLSLPDNVCLVGYDISPQAYELAKNLSRDRLRFVLGDFLLSDERVFDLLLVIDVIEHIDDYFGFLRSLRVRGTYKLFHIPLDMSVRKVLFGVPMLRRHQFGHIHYFMKETALASLEDTGYQIVDWVFTSRDLDTRANTITRALAKALLRTAKMINENLAVRILGGHSLMVLAR